MTVNVSVLVERAKAFSKKYSASAQKLRGTLILNQPVNFLYSQRCQECGEISLTTFFVDSNCFSSGAVFIVVKSIKQLLDFYRLFLTE